MHLCFCSNNLDMVILGFAMDIVEINICSLVYNVKWGLLSWYKSLRRVNNHVRRSHRIYNFSISWNDYCSGEGIVKCPLDRLKGISKWRISSKVLIGSFLSSLWLLGSSCGLWLALSMPRLPIMFLSIASASLSEVETIMYICLELGYFKNININKTLNNIKVLNKRINALRNKQIKEINNGKQ